MNFLLLLLVPVLGVWIPGAKWAHSAAQVFGNLIPGFVDINHLVIEIYSLRVSATRSICETAGVNTFKMDQLLIFKDRMLSFYRATALGRGANIRYRWRRFMGKTTEADETWYAYGAARSEMIESVRDAQASVYKLLKTLKIMPYKYLEKKASETETDRCVLVADVAAQWNKALADIIGLAMFNVDNAKLPKEQNDQKELIAKLQKIANLKESDEAVTTPDHVSTDAAYQTKVFRPAVISLTKTLFVYVEKCLKLVVDDLEGWRTKDELKKADQWFKEKYPNSGDMLQFINEAMKMFPSKSGHRGSVNEDEFITAMNLIDHFHKECTSRASKMSLSGSGEQACFARLGFSGQIIAAHYLITEAFKALDAFSASSSTSGSNPSENRESPDTASRNRYDLLQKALRMVYLAELNSMTLVGYFVFKPYSSFNQSYKSYRQARVLEREILYRRLLSMRKKVVEVLLVEGAQVQPAEVDVKDEEGKEIPSLKNESQLTPNTPPKQKVKEMLLGSLAKSYALFLRAKAKLAENHAAVSNSGKSVGNMLTGLWRVDKGTKLGPAATARFELSAIEYGAVDFYKVIISGLKHCVVNVKCTRNLGLPEPSVKEETAHPTEEGLLVRAGDKTKELEDTINSLGLFFDCRREIETEVGSGIFESPIKAHFKVFVKKNGCGSNQLLGLKTMRVLKENSEIIAVGSIAGSFASVLAVSEGLGFFAAYTAAALNSGSYAAFFGQAAGNAGSAAALGIHSAILGKVAIGLSIVGAANPVGLPLAAAVLGAVVVVYGGRRMVIRNIRKKKISRANRITRGLNYQIKENIKEANVKKGPLLSSKSAK